MVLVVTPRSRAICSTLGRAEAAQRFARESPRRRRDGARRGGRGEGIVGKIWWAFVSKYAAISPRKISPNSRSFFSPTPLMRRSRFRWRDNSAPSAAARRRKKQCSGHVAFVSELFAELAQAVEQNFVAGNFADVVNFRFRHDGGFGERDFSAFLSAAPPASVNSNTLNFSVVCRRKPSRTSSRPMAAIPAAVLLADAVGRKLRVIPLAIFSVSAPVRTSTT